MSVLLDALKRAALDKKKGQSGTDQTAAEPVESGPVPTAQQAQVAEPVVEEPVADELVMEELTLDESLHETIEETLEESEELTELLDDDAIFAQEWNTEELDELVSETDLEPDTVDLDVDLEAVLEADDPSGEADPEFESRKEQQELQFALMQAEEKREQERRDREFRQAEIERQEELQRQKEEAARVFEEEARRREKEEAEKLQEKQLLLQQAREQAEEEARMRAESETALTTLVHEGHAINKRQKQRSRFLYAVLVLTAGGAIIAYYLYLLGNQAEMPVLYEQAARESSAIAEETVATEQDIEETGTPIAATTEVAGTKAVSEGSTLQARQEAVSESVTERAAANPDEPYVEQVASRVRAFTPIERFDTPPSAGDLSSAFFERASDTITNNRVAEDNARSGQDVVHVYHKAVPTRLSETINEAYRAYQAENLSQADRLYREALRADPRNRDALLGAAAIATDRGEYNEAIRLYQIRLNDNPADSHARSALMALSSQSDFVASDIDRLLEQTPGDAHLHFLKGYAHAVNNEWVDAQAAFFDAHHWDQSNPDYAYNLAVSLDHLGQRPAAIRFYRQALELSRDRKGVFSTEQANQRLAQLSEGVSE